SLVLSSRLLMRPPFFFTVPAPSSIYTLSLHDALPISRRVMALGFAVWVVFEIAFLLALETDSAFLVGAAYFFRGFGFPLFAFAFLVWINAVVDKRRNGAAVGWFYVMFTGGLPTLGSLVAVFMIPSFGGGFSGQKWTMIASTVIVAIGFCIAWFGVKERHGSIRLAPEGESAGAVISS